MTIQDAKELLLMHSGMHPDKNHPKVETGFLGSIFDYENQGLVESNLHEVMKALRVVGPELSGEKVDRKVVNALWSMCVYARRFGLDPNGELQQEQTITAHDSYQLLLYVEAIESASLAFMEGADSSVALDTYSNLDLC